jgi:predicted secreted protein
MTNFKTIGRLALPALACGLLFLGGCSSSHKPNTLTVRPDMQDAVVEQATMVTKGDTVVVYLPTQTGGAHNWRLSPESAKQNEMTLLRRTQQVTGSATKSGQPAFDVFTFQTNRTGQTSVDFIYDWTWSGETAPVKRFSLNVDVTKPGQMQTASVNN